MFEFYTMTSLQFTQAQCLGFTRGMYRVPLSIPTYDSVIKVHGMVLASSPGHFPPPIWPRSVWSSSMCIVCSYQIATKYYLTVLWKRCRDGALPIRWPLLSCIIPTLFAHFLACHPYIFLHFKCFLYSCFYTFLISVTTRPNSKKSSLLIFFHM